MIIFEGDFTSMDVSVSPIMTTTKFRICLAACNQATQNKVPRYACNIKKDTNKRKVYNFVFT